MPVLHARIATDRAARYLAQFCRHATAMGDGRGHRIRRHGGAGARPAAVRVTEFGDTRGVVEFEPWGRAEFTAEPALLSIRLDAADAAAAARLCAVIGDDLRRFGRLDVEWVAAEPESAPGDPR
ncbi:DUF2218 domain-containing protein [Nocardia sp. alder85J]|uniref:DUF2218 domain-containing protein n=1 Tax=Nocardia sp. alder85J TaxID=2862949 RepID=UPI001CD1AB25|nr:DUF2218 domain-containing protein [Nocardia sp. alder85J]MCX4091682.1 DUF2218 domain-containing protein [Nocardia sp. alder85J]